MGGAALPLSGRCSGGIAASLVADGDVHIPIPAAVAVSPHVLAMEDDPGPSRHERCHHKGHHGGEGAGSPGCRPRSHGTGPGSREGSRASARSCPAAALDPASGPGLDSASGLLRGCVCGSQPFAGSVTAAEWESNQRLRAEPDPWFWGATRPPRVHADAHQAGSRGLGGRGA